MCRGAAGSENLPADLQGRYSGRKERLRSNPQTMDRDSNRSCRLTRHKRRRKHLPAIHPHWPRLVGSAPQAPRDLAHSANPGEQQQKRDIPSDAQTSRLRSWLLARRSVRVSAWTYPPTRLPTILSATPAPNHCRCAPFEANNPRRQVRSNSTKPAATLENRTYFGSDRRLRTRYTRSWAVAFSLATHL